MKSLPTLSALLLLPLASVATADTIRLKNGTKYEGKVIKEDAEAYVVEVQITKSIKDEKRIPKAEVASIDRELPDQKAFKELPMDAAPDLLEASDYQVRIAKMYAFIKAYPMSTHLSQVKKITTQLEQEQTAIEAGGLKLNGKIIPAAERQADAVEFDAKVLAASVRRHADAGAYVPALRAFAELEKDFVSTDTFRDLLPQIRQTLQAFRAQVAAESTSHAQRVKERDAGLTQMKPEDRVDTQAALAEQAKQAKALADADKKAGHKWLMPDPWNKSSLDETLRFIDQETKRLDALKIDTTVNGGKAWRDASTAIKNNDQAATTEAMKAVRAAKLPARYISRLDEAAKAAGLKP